MRSQRRLPTTAPMPVPKRFAEIFVKHGWEKCERIWGVNPTERYRFLVGVEKLEQMKRLRGTA